MKNHKKIITKIRKNILERTFIAKSSHIGSCLSIVEILYCLYFLIKKKKDSFVLSKGHAALALYSTLFQKKIINKKTFESYGKNNTVLMSHIIHKVKGVEFSTGSLGHGLPFALGKALYFKSKKLQKKVFVLLSDGELNEGTTWEALLFASHHKLDNLIIIIDYNKIQSLGNIKNILKIEPLEKKINSFGAKVFSCDGHDINKLKRKFLINTSKKPKVIIAHTVKGKGISFMENNNLWHYKNPNEEEFKIALKEVEYA